MTITSKDFIELIKKEPDLNILDIRSDLEFETYALDYPVTHIPLHEVTPEKIIKTNKPTYVLCKAGPRAQKCADFLSSQGYKNLIVVDGGITGCAECGGNIDMKRDDVPIEQIQQAVQDSVQKFMTKHA